MTNKQICEYMKHYIEKDKTNSAVMLTAPWGKGKSFFIQNELIPYLKKNGNHQSVVVSLYGVASLEEISKSIYFSIKSSEIREKLEKKAELFECFKRKKSKKKVSSEIVPMAKIAGSTVIRGITSFVGIDLSLKNLEQLYTSVDLTGKLLVFEDIERSRVNLVEFLGYVNSIVEQDDVKVLLIANENELIHYEQNEEEEGGEKKQVQVYTESSSQYLKFKEKTVSDTILFQGNVKEAIKAITKRYDCKQFAWRKDEAKLDEIEQFLLNSGVDNLRTFIYSCQKTFEIYEQISEYNLDDDPLECIFFQIVLFSKSIKTGRIPAWNGTEYLSPSLTGARFPLFRFCYEYIRWHSFDKSKIAPTIKAYDEYRMVNQMYDDDLSVIFNYYVSSEAKILGALKNIDRRLDTPFDVPFCMYSKLAYYLVKLHFLLDYDFSSIRQKMLNNLKTNGQDVSIQGLMMYFFEFEADAEKELFVKFRKDIEESIKSSQQDIGGFLYEPTSIDELQKKADSRTQYSHRFISLYDLEKMVDMLFQCDAQQLQNFRKVMFSVYQNALPEQFEIEDCKFMEGMLDLISEKKNNLPANFDRIQLMQMDYLCENIEMFISRLQ